MMWDFAFWREQMCTLACPYARFQSVLLDRSSLIVGYDERRGEPRGNARKLAQEGITAGDCVDCNKCVTTCPTGIDIRKGLQLECIHCTQCMDACDEVMEKVGKPKGLIRYGSKDQFAGKKSSMLRPRVVIYPILLIGMLTLLVLTLLGRKESTVEFQRATGHAPYSTTEDGNIRNLANIRITNRTDDPHTYDVQLKGDGQLLKPTMPMSLEAQGFGDAPIHIILAPTVFTGERHQIVIELLMDGKVVDEATHSVLGPRNL
ncbi:MAG: 4Fe-4S dicluster domain-containing protein [Planctomycetota bacterium]